MGPSVAKSSCFLGGVNPKMSKIIAHSCF